MKRIILATLAVLSLTAHAWAEDFAFVPVKYEPVAQVLELEADAENQLLSSRFIGAHLTQIEIDTETDAAITFSILSGLTGTTLFTVTTTAANAGEIHVPTAYYLFTHQPKYTLDGLAAEDTATIVISGE